ncbi:MAG TPA: cysteine hydrolase family protein [Propionibacteriaceae bacterium]|nr:cysteine hydrolase family protein [Propionibacteriaceae bacterium]
MTTALLVIDVQNEYVSGALPIVHPPVEGSLTRIGEAVDAANAAGLPVVLVRHTEPDPTAGLFVAGTPAWELHASVAARPHDAVVDKQLPGSFTGTGLEELLAARGVDHVVVAGYMTHMCVDTTTRQAMHLGLDVTVLDDATGTIDLADDLPAALVHRVELGVLGDGFATVSPTARWIASLG